MSISWGASIRLSQNRAVSWRSILINHPARLKREHFALVVEQEQSARVPFEDIAVIILNHPQITLTHPVLAACADHGIGLYSTGDNHQPNGLLLPFLQHSRATRILRLQLALDRPSTKRAWMRIVQAKINNQARCLALLGLAGVDWLHSLSRQVRSGDTGNMEAQASARYFPLLFDPGFHRKQCIWVNAMLDYGYAVIRGACARALVQHGLLPSIGLFHANEQNAFNLADDLIEPYRPVVDLCVARHPPAPEESELTPANKATLVSLLNVDVVMPRGQMSLLSSVEQAAESLVRLYEGKGIDALELPTLIELQQHQFEF